MRKSQKLLDINVIFAHLRNIIILYIKSLRFLTNLFIAFDSQISHFNDFWREIFELNV